MSNTITVKQAKDMSDEQLGAIPYEEISSAPAR